MKLKFFVFFLLFQSINMCAQKTYIPDDYFELFLISLGYDSGPLDDYVPTENINSIVELDILSLDIKSLEGLQDFTSLEILNLFLYDVKNINLTNNDKLKELVIRDDLLEKIDITNNTELEVFYLIVTNVTELDVSNNIKLNDIIIANSKIINIDLGLNAQLEKVALTNGIIENINLKNSNNNIITSFNASGLPNLKCIRVDNSDYSLANWTNIDDNSVFSETCGDFKQYTYVPDDYFEQYLIDSGYDTGSLNNYVPTDNINSIVELEIHIPKINSLEGIQDFISLEKLSLFLDDVKNINLKNNIKLKELIISDDLLESLDITNNTELEIFYLTIANVTELDLSKNLKLKAIGVGTTSIINLDLSLNTQLEKVEITHGIIENINLKNSNNTNITNFNAEGLFNLQCFRVDDKNYSLVNWTNIDDNSVFSETCGNFEKFTYIPDDNFEQTLIDFGYDSGTLDNYVLTSNINTISELNLNFKNISDLTGIEDFIALENLQFTQNKISELNISTLVNLNTLYCNNNNLSVLDVSKNILLVDLFLGGNSISEINITSNTLIKQLEISNNNFTEINTLNNPELILLNCSENKISQLNLSNNLNLTYLNCSFNNINQLNLINYSKLFDVYCANNPLTKLELPSNNILDGLHVNATLISELDLRNQSNIISHPASFLQIQDNPNLKCVFVDDVDRFNNDVWSSITKDVKVTFVTNEVACVALNCQINVDTLSNIDECDFFELPSITNGSYFTQTNGAGNQLKSGDIISTSQTIFIYNIDASNTKCFNESNFTVNITKSPLVDSFSNINTTSNYTLPILTNGHYFTQTNGTGNQLKSGDIISTSQTIFIYNVDDSNTNCYNESSFNVIINSIIDNHLIIPVFFTPNNDGINDFWVLQNSSEVSEVYIYNRFGKLVGKPNINIGWNGSYNGKNLSSATYWYLIILKNSNTLKGYFSLIK